MSTILKLKKLVKLGYVPSRGAESYSFVNQKSGEPFYLSANCFEHACFNLTNQQMQELKIGYHDAISFADHVSFFSSVYDIEESLTKFIRSTGLKIREINNFEPIINFPALLKNNEWKVALYFCKNGSFKDFHFFLQEKNGTWSSKYGFKNVLEFFDNLPGEYVVDNEYNDIYHYHNTYLITNPYAPEIENKEECEHER